MPVVRISRGTFSADAFDEVAARLDESQRSLVPATEQLSGLVSYYAGADADSNPMINVSVWKSIGAVNQMAILPEMFALAGEVFERAPFQPMPISNPLQNDERQPSLRPLLIGTSALGGVLENVCRCRPVRNWLVEKCLVLSA